MAPWKSRLNIFVQKLSEDRLPVGDAKQITFVKDRDLSGYFWKGEGTILYSRDFGGDENFLGLAGEDALAEGLRNQPLAAAIAVTGGSVDDILVPTQELLHQHGSVQSSRGGIEW